MKEGLEGLISGTGHLVENQDKVAAEIESADAEFLANVRQDDVWLMGFDKTGVKVLDTIIRGQVDRVRTRGTSTLLIGHGTPELAEAWAQYGRDLQLVWMLVRVNTEPLWRQVDREMDTRPSVVERQSTPAGRRTGDIVMVGAIVLFLFMLISLATSGW